MTPKQYKSLARYMGSIADQLGLSDWDISLHAREPGNAADETPALTSVTTHFGRRSANVRVCHDFEDFPRTEQRMAVVHELLHVHARGVSDLLTTALPKLVGLAAYESLFAAYTIHDELANDAITQALAPHMPLWDMPE